MNLLKHFLSVGLVVLFTLGIYGGSTAFISAQESTPAAVPSKVPMEISPLNDIAGKGGNGNDETPGEWFLGETPDNLIENAPILLFVPGLNNVAQIFWENNNMYDTAYQAGYQTAFLQLHDAGGASADMWNNGELLAAKIQEISNYFDGKPITVVAYSKGGVDTQTAITYYGAGPYVENVITLSSPHHGSELADLAYSGGAGWLADLIGMQGDGTAAMQTAYMADFRTQTDANGNAYDNNYFTIGGTSWGSMFSANWFGGIYLSSYGQNDGVVTAASSNLPGGQELMVGDWNHTTVRTGATFPVFQNYLSGDHLTGVQHKSQYSDQKNNPAPSANRWVDGGPLNDQAKIEFKVEENVKSLSLQLLTAESLADLVLFSPNGEKVDVDVKEVQLEEGVFKDAIGYAIELPQPEIGTWNIAVRSQEEENAYMFIADFESAPLITAERSHHLLQNENRVVLNANSSQIDTEHLVVDYHIIETQHPANQRQWRATGPNALSHSLNMNKEDSIYTATVTIKGKTKAGNEFNRSIIYSY